MSSTGVLGWVRDWVSRSHEPAKGDASRAMSLEHLPISASVFVIAVVAVGCVVVILQGPREITHPAQFAALLAASVLASSLRLRLPLGTSASNLSISYSVDFAALLLIGREMTMLVAGASACAQSIFGTSRRNPAFRILFNAAALVLTVQAAGVTFTYFGGKPGDLDLTSIAKPLVASALAYYLVNTLIVATAVGLAARQPVWHVWQTNFLWTAPSYFVGAGAELVANYPLSVIVDGVGLNITVVSYKNRVDFGIVGDREQIDDAWAFLESAGHALQELEEIGQRR